jgi:hypothetical protein
MTTEEVYWHWHEKLKKNSKQARVARKKWHKTDDRDAEVEYFALLSERHAIQSFMEDLREINPQIGEEITQ